MFKTYQSFLKAQERVVELQELQKRLSVRLSYDDQEELDALMEACRCYVDSLDAEARAEHEFMNRFEEQFLASMER